MLKRSVFVLALLCATAAQATYSVGQTPADFTLDDWDGGTWNLAAQQGKVVLINFGATW
jgi:peroxiredoxin